MVEDKDIKRSFGPIVGDRAEVLILGSIPGDRSISDCEYYAHPQNRFWRVIASITGSDSIGCYEEKKQMLVNSRIALWDVAGEAVRKGSMDNAIRDAVPNDIAGLLQENKTIKTVVFNGKTAERLYDRHFDRLDGILYLSMPSTSPANATFSFDRLCNEWGKVLCKR